MTSYLAQYGRLRERTLEAYSEYGHYPRHVNERLDFYLLYLQDVVPYGITVHHFPCDVDPSSSTRYPKREEIRLLTWSGRIFMTGLVSVEPTALHCEQVAGDEAYTRSLSGDFVDHHWRFFTALVQLRFCDGVGDEGWERVEEFRPIDHAWVVAEYLQHEYYRLAPH